MVCNCYPLLGEIYQSQGENEKAITQFEKAIGIATSFGWHDRLFWNHYSLADLSLSENKLNDAHAHVEHAKSHATDGPYNLGCAMRLQAQAWYREGRFDEAKCEALGAAEIFEKFGATRELGFCKDTVRIIETAINKQAGSPT